MASGLTDMEELLERVVGAEIKSFMKEALVCYGAGAHRACIVLSFIAVFEDLRQKVRIAGGLNADAKAISKDIEKLADGQKPFENDLVNRLASKSLLTAIQAKRLGQMIDFRNKAAHPSGHHASAEEARFVYFEAVDQFLSRPLLSAEGFAKALLQRLRDTNYFPDTTIANIKPAVIEEIEQLNPAAYPFLTSQLVAGIADPDADFARNCNLFLTGLGVLKRPELRDLLAKALIKAKASNAGYRDLIASIISADATVLKGADQVTLGRVNALLMKLLAATDASVSVRRLKHPITVVRSMVRDLEEADVLPDYLGFLEAVAAGFWSNAELTYALSPLPGVRALLLNTLYTRAGSNDFTTANRFAQALPDLQTRLAAELSPAETLTLLGEVRAAAQTGAWSASALADARFVTIPLLRDAAIACVDATPADAQAALAKWAYDPTVFKAQYLQDPA